MRRAGSSPAVRTSSILGRSVLLAGLAIATAGCNPHPDGGAVVVSAIGGSPPRPLDPARQPLTTPDRLLLGATAQGLVRFDAAGQIEPALAERWIVIDDGMSYIFRLRDAQWTDGTPVTTDQVVRSLTRAVARSGRDPLSAYLTAIDEIVAMTPEVVEIRLNRPRPDLLKLFAQPELAIFRTDPFRGTGPFAITRRDRNAVLLTRVPDPERDDDEAPDAPVEQQRVRLIGERAALAIVRFANDRADAVMGGEFTDWPLVSIANLPADTVRIDPATGLFGLAVLRRDGFLSLPQNRAAVAAAIQRPRLLAAFTASWSPATALLPEQIDSAAPPAQPSWTSLSIDDAAAIVAAWQKPNPGPVTLRIALPTGPGANILWGFIAADLAHIGIIAERVRTDAPADLRLVDAVAPYDNARWYLATACASCAAEARDAIEGARLAPNLAERARLTAKADALLTADVAFIPIAQPLRWSLVGDRLKRWQGNPRDWHPLDQLLREKN